MASFQVRDVYGNNAIGSVSYQDGVEIRKMDALAGQEEPSKHVISMTHTISGQYVVDIYVDGVDLRASPTILEIKATALMQNNSNVKRGDLVCVTDHICGKPAGPSGTAFIALTVSVTHILPHLLIFLTKLTPFKLSCDLN